MPSQSPSALSLAFGDYDLSLLGPSPSELKGLGIGRCGGPEIVDLFPQALCVDCPLKLTRVERLLGRAHHDRGSLWVTIFMLKSRAGTEWVKAPAEI